MQKNLVKQNIATLSSQSSRLALSQLTLGLWQVYRHSRTISVNNRLSKLGMATLATGLLYAPASLAQTTVLPAEARIAQLSLTENSIDNVSSDTPANRISQTNESTTDITASNAISTIAVPIPQPNSARTRPNFTPNPKQQASLERLKQFYQKNGTQSTDNNAPTVQSDDTTLTQPLDTVANTAIDTTVKVVDSVKQPPMCYGTWVYPQASQANVPSEYQHNAAEAAKTDKANSEFPLYAQADYGYYDNENYAELSGNVYVNQGRQQINADKVVVNLQDGIAAAQGNVMLVDAAQTALSKADDSDSTDKPRTAQAKSGLITVADEIAYQTDSTKATAKDVAFASVPLQAHGYAKQLNKVDESRYEIDDTMFTTCTPDNPTWQINAKNIDIDTDTGRGEAYNATFKVKNTPVFYLPYFNFPIDDRRSSGFLLPKAGFSTDGGLNVQVPYYFNLAPNYDATLTPSIYTNRNPMLTGEFRYLTEGFGHGNLTASYLPKDQQYHDKDRSSVFFDHRWQSPDIRNLSAEAVYQYVSDSAYLNDFDTLGTLDNKLNLPRRIQANYYNGYLTALAKIETFQTLNKNIDDDQIVLDKDKPYQRLPQLSVQYRVPTEILPWAMPEALQKLNITGVSDFAYFKRPIYDGSALEQSGGRLYNKLTASYPLSRPWGYVTPAVSLQHLYTQFDEATTLANNIDKDNKSKSIFVPEVSVDTGLNFYKTGSPLKKSNDGGYQLISPRLKYVYAPYKDQSDVPNFNTRLASLNFPQLYENSWFLGYDRLADSNFLTPSINYRYIDGNGLTRLDASIGQQFYLGDVRVHLDNSNNPLRLDSSGTVLQLSSQPRVNFWLDVDGAVTDSGELGYINTQFRYRPNADSLYNVGYIKRNANTLGQKDLSAITASAILPLDDVLPIVNNWRFLGAVQFDNERSRFSDVLTGFTYDSCCYGFSVYGRSYYNDLASDDKPTRAIMAELSLNGFANKRQGRLSDLMGERVLGYRDLTGF